jgi:hypothetical protein
MYLDVSEDRSASVFKVSQAGSKQNNLLTGLLIENESVHFSQSSTNFFLTTHHSSEDGALHSHERENLESRIKI